MVDRILPRPMPEGFTDRAAWDAIHFQFSEQGSLLDQAVILWQRENQDRVRAALAVAAPTTPGADE